MFEEFPPRKRPPSLGLSDATMRTPRPPAERSSRRAGLSGRSVRLSPRRRRRNRTSTGWWATNRFEASVTRGNIDLDRLGLVGNTQTLLTRLQWIY